MEAQEVEICRKAFNSGITRPLEWRRQQLDNLFRMMDENSATFVKALAEDLRKPEQEALCMEVDYVKNMIRGVTNHFDEWTKDEYVEKNFLTLLDETFIHHDPLGVVLIMGAWNYPVQLTFGPLPGAIAAGNCVIIKPSEISDAVSRAMAELVPKYLHPECFRVVEGGIPETTRLLQCKFDHIFYTGSTRVGQIVREASNKFLTPVTLELGGKSPTYICESADMDLTVKRLIWAKCINLGQTCVAPDYVLCSESVQKVLVPKALELIKEWYGENPQKSPDLCRIVNRRNFDRLSAMLDKTRGKVYGGATDPDDCYIQPTLVTGVDYKGDSLMQEEIFGPILPIITVKDKEEAIDLINSGEKPLTLYVFTKKKDVMDAFKLKTSSGSAVINDAIVHLSVETLPFGGVGQSGMGQYHGKYTFQEFSHQKSILVRDFSAFGEYLGSIRYPPYSMDKVKRTQFLIKNRKTPGFLSYIPHFAWFLVGIACGVGGYYLANNRELTRKYLGDYL
eukprot:TRINITY_DN18525_c1_g1_i1.p1 TRINITY_DN18525_c1_g1~~TRINITY_DN18525_c1_g1_i1.p1  ORF type:complete len:507 (-),score=75.73 TRINITY_DN18525_c1_g1_i1:234-1754(-)